MDRTIYLGRDTLMLAPEELRRILADWTGSARAAASLLTELGRVRAEAAEKEVSHCFVFPGEGGADGGWRVQVGYDDSRLRIYGTA